MESVAILDRWDQLPVRYRYMAGAFLAFLISIASGVSDMRWATPAWVIMGLIGAFLCLYAFPSVWRYLVHLGLIYFLIAIGAIAPLFYLERAPLWIGWAFVFHIAGLLVAYNLVKDVNLSRRAYHMAAMSEEKTAPYVPMGLWLLALLVFILLTDVSMYGFSLWARQGASIALYVVSEVIIIGLLLYLLNVPERAFGGKGRDFVPRVSITEMTSETKKVVKKLVKRSSGMKAAKRAAKVAHEKLRPKVLAGGTLECPVCSSELAIDRRRCPECYRENEFAWCPVSEHYIIPCPACGKPTVYGEDACSHCGQPLTIDYKCPQCLKSTPLNRWERA